MKILARLRQLRDEQTLRDWQPSNLMARTRYLDGQDEERKRKRHGAQSVADTGWREQERLRVYRLDLD